MGQHFLIIIKYPLYENSQIFIRCIVDTVVSIIFVGMIFCKLSEKSVSGILITIFLVNINIYNLLLTSLKTFLTDFWGVCSFYNFANFVYSIGFSYGPSSAFILTSVVLYGFPFLKSSRCLLVDMIFSMVLWNH